MATDFQNLDDDMVKLVAYAIVSVRRGHERIMPGGEGTRLVIGRMTKEAFTALIIGRYVQQEDTNDKKDAIREVIYALDRYLGKKLPEDTLIFAGELSRYLTESLESNNGNGKKKKKLRRIDEEDRKYLRLHYVVTNRWSRQPDQFEEDQIDVLGQIRDELRGGYAAPVSRVRSELPPFEQRIVPEDAAPEDVAPVSDPYEKLAGHIASNSDTFATLRQNFARCSAQLGPKLSTFFNRYAEVGKFIAPKLEPKAVSAAFRETRRPFNRESLDRFAGHALGDTRLYVPRKPPAAPHEIPLPPLHSVWNLTTADDGTVTQKITASIKDFVSPDDSLKLKEFLAEGTVDLSLNLYREDLGIVSWTSFHQNQGNQLRSIGYEMEDKVIWINQFLNPEMKPILGPLPPAPPGGSPLIVVEDQFLVTLEFAQLINNKRCFCIYGLHLNFDFKKCSVVFAGRIFKMLNELVEK